MKLGLLTACMPQVGLEELVAWAAGIGFDMLELAAWPITPDTDYQARQIDAASFTIDDAKRVRDLFTEYNLDISAMAYYDNNLHPDPQKRKEFHAHLKKVIDVASLLDVPLVGTFVGGRPDKNPADNIKQIGKVFRELVQYAEGKGVKLMIDG